MNKLNLRKSEGASSRGKRLARASLFCIASAALFSLAACGGDSGGAADVLSAEDTVESAIEVKAVSAAQVTVSGAIFTTASVAGVCGGTNLNNYPTLQDVYLNGGPRQGDSAGLPDGDYWVKITDPSGATLLGTSPFNGTQPVKVSGGVFTTCPQLWDILVKGTDGTKGYDPTPNPGCVFKVWVSKDRNFPENLSKTDNFRVCKDGQTPPPVGILDIQKYYDANANGMKDVGESYLLGWKVNVSPTIASLTTSYDISTGYHSEVTPGDYLVSEYMPIPAAGVTWVQTEVRVDVQGVAAPLVGPFSSGSANFSILDGKTYYVTFGNVCLAGGSGKTLGFWSNRNGKAIFEKDTSGNLSFLSSLNLVGADGSAFNPGSYDVLKAWLLNGNAVNMAYMLSVQLTAMELNVRNNLVGASSVVYAPGLNGASSLGFISIAALMAQANTALGLDGLTLSGDANRAYQEVLKNALDNANNNKNFVSATPCAFTF